MPKTSKTDLTAILFGLIITAVVAKGLFQQIGLVPIVSIIAGWYALALVVQLFARWKENKTEQIESRRPCKHGVLGANRDYSKCPKCSLEREQLEVARLHEQERKQQEAELKRKQAYDDLLAKIRLPEYLRSMDPYKFEQLICSLFRRMGYKAEETPYVGDNGVDGFLYKDNLKVVLQCKRVKGSVGEPVLRDLFGTMHATASDSAIVVTTGRVSEQARTWAGGKPIRLIELSELQTLIQENFRDGEVVPAEFVPSETGFCPKCHSALRVVNGPRGKFIGCTGYPKCRFTRRYDPKAGILK